MTYQEIFNNHLKSIRLACNATGNKALADTIVKLMFDFSDELKAYNLIKGDKDNDRQRNFNK